MEPGIVIPLVVLPLVIIGVFVWYRRSIAKLKPDDTKPVSGVRLTAETLHRLGPPWRVIYEIGNALGGVDHVVVGPPGVIAITTVVADRPLPERLTESSGTAKMVSDAAIARGPVDELARPAGATCQLSARVYWGAPDPARAAFDTVAHGSQLIEGQRVDEWLASVAASVGPEAIYHERKIDQTWQAIVMGIGRPDPLP